LAFALRSTGSAAVETALFVGFPAVGSEEARSIALALTSVAESCDNFIPPPATEQVQPVVQQRQPIQPKD
jgi:hypothetical protein